MTRLRLAAIFVLSAFGCLAGTRPPPSYRSINVEGSLKDSFRDPIDPLYHIIYLQATNCHYYIFLKEPSKETVSNVNSLIGGRIRTKGALLNFSPNLPRPFTREILLGANKIETLEPPPDDPFAASCYTNLFGMASDDINKQGTRTAKGRVLAVWGRDNILLRTPQGNVLLVTAKSPALPAPGASVEVVGLPETTIYNLSLNRAIWRPVADVGPAAENVQAISAKDLATEIGGESYLCFKFHGQVVKVRGVICGLSRANPGDNVMYLDDAGQIVPVNVDAAASALDALAIGSAVEVTGVCVINAPAWRPNSGLPNAKTYAIVTRAPGDIRLLSRPPWLTAGKLLVIVGVLVAVIILILIWNFLLRVVSERRGRALAREQVQRIESDFKVQERTRLAVELHDSLAQDLARLSKKNEETSDSPRFPRFMSS